METLLNGFAAIVVALGGPHVPEDSQGKQYRPWNSQPYATVSGSHTTDAFFMDGSEQQRYDTYMRRNPPKTAWDVLQRPTNDPGRPYGREFYHYPPFGGSSPAAAVPRATAAASASPWYRSTMTWEQKRAQDKRFAHGAHMYRP